jgi:hypothetical protein
MKVHMLDNSETVNNIITEAIGYQRLVFSIWRFVSKKRCNVLSLTCVKCLETC